MKKITSVLLMAMLLFSLIPANLSFAAATTVYTEDFEDATWGQESMITTTAQLDNSSLTPVSGYTGNAISVSGSSADSLGAACIYTNPFSTLGLNQTTTLVYTQRIKFVGTPDSTFYMAFYDNSANDGYQSYVGVKDGKFVFASSGSANGMASAVEIGSDWYTYVSKLSYNESSSNYSFSNDIYDSKGTKVYTRTVSSANYTNGARRFSYRFGGLNTTSSVLLDDASLYVADASSTFTLDSANSSSADNVVTLSFDQPVIPAASNFTVKDGSGNAVTGASVKVTQVDFKKVEVTVSGLTANTDYTLDFAGLSAVSGNVITGTTSFDFKTAESEPEPSVVFTEDFTTIPSNGTYGSNTGSTVSEVFFNGSGDAAAYVSATGYDGTANSALKIQNGSNTNADYICTKSYISTFGFSDTAKLVFNIRFKAVGTISDSLSAMIRLAGGNGSGMLEIKGDTTNNTYYVVRNASNGGVKDRVDISADKWYDFQIVMTKTVGANTISASGYMFDSLTGELLKTTSISNIDGATGYAYIFCTGFADGAGVVFDDAKMYCVETGNIFSNVAEGTTASGTTIAEDGNITVKFSNPILAKADEYVVTGADGAAKVSAVKIKDFNTAVLSFSGLTAGEEYTLDYSGVKSAGGATLSGTTNTLTFKTPNKTVFTEEFNNNWGYYGDFKTTNSEIFTSGPQNTSYVLAKGYDDENALKVTGGSNGKSSLRTKTFTNDFGLSDTNSLVMNMRFKMLGSDDAADDFELNITPNDSTRVAGWIKATRDAETNETKYMFKHMELTADLWYNMTIHITKSLVEITVYEADSGKYIIYSSTDYTHSTEKNLVFTFNPVSGGCGMVFDDATLYVVDNSEEMTLTSASIENGTEIDFDDTIELTFDKTIAAKTTDFTITGGDGRTTVAAVNVVDFNKAVVSFRELKGLVEDYVLDFSALTSAAGNALSDESQKTVSFKTGIDPIYELTLVGNAACSGTDVGDTVSFKLYSKSGVTPQLVVAFYDVTTIPGATEEDEDTYVTKLEGVETLNTQAIPQQETTSVTVTLTKKHENANAIKLFAWDDFGSLNPLMNEAAVEFP